MELDPSQRRALLALCCEVARADGAVNSLELEALLERLARLAQGAVGYSELAKWLEQGAPMINVQLPDEAVRMFLREAIAVARADGQVDDVEITTIKELFARHFTLR